MQSFISESFLSKGFRWEEIDDLEIERERERNRFIVQCDEGGMEKAKDTELCLLEPGKL